MMSATPATVKLSNSFVPKSYDLTVSTDIENWSYEGKETIVLRRVQGSEKSNKVHLHYSPSMMIKKVTGATIINRNVEAGTLELQLEGQSKEEEHTVTFDFSHEIQEEMHGFYRVHFKTSDGVEHRMAATHFEPISARRFYICQDEPAARADFTLHVSLPSCMDGYVVLSNGPLKLKECQGGVVTHHFETVSAIPPYLTSCFVGEFEHIGTTVCGIPVNLYTAHGRLKKASFALKTTAFALEYFEKFFDCKYPLPKLDVVALPDFPIGGMENWGCIACVEAILVDEKTSSLEALKRAAALLCHEVSHNWFGNLVAINWWEGLWLKEGFASWCGYTAAHELQPSWRSDEDATMEVASALVSDMYENSHPVELPIHDPSEITQIFDAISYDKGMGLVFMLKAFLGEKKWKTSIAKYIQKYRYGDTQTVQLWETLEEVSGVPLTEAMQSFTTQMGFPLIHVSRPTPETLLLQQEPCQFVSADQKRKTLWHVPIVLEGADGVKHHITLRGADVQSVELPEELAKSAWINANPSRQGFFRCRYDDKAFSALLNVYGSLSVPDRCGLIVDTMASIYMGNKDMERLAIFPSLLSEHESDRSVWEEYYSTMIAFLRFLEDKTLRNELTYYLMYRIRERAKKLLDQAPRTAEERLQHGFFINASISTALKCMPRDEAQKDLVVAWALKEAEAYMNGSVYLIDTLAMSLSAYVCLGPGSMESRTNALWRRFTEVHDSDEESRSILKSLCFAEDPEFVESIAKRCIYNNGVRSQYGSLLFSSMLSNPSLPKGYVWSLFKKHFDGVKQQWGDGTFRIQNIVENVGMSLTSDAEAKEFNDFFRTNPLPNAGLAICRAVERIKLHAWLMSEWGTGPKLSYIFIPR